MIGKTLPPGLSWLAYIPEPILDRVFSFVGRNNYCRSKIYSLIVKDEMECWGDLPKISHEAYKKKLAADSETVNRIGTYFYNAHIDQDEGLKDATLITDEYAVVHCRTPYRLFQHHNARWHSFCQETDRFPADTRYYGLKLQKDPFDDSFAKHYVLLHRPSNKVFGGFCTRAHARHVLDMAGIAKTELFDAVKRNVRMVDLPVAANDNHKDDLNLKGGVPITKDFNTLGLMEWGRFCSVREFKEKANMPRSNEPFKLVLMQAFLDAIYSFNNIGVLTTDSLIDRLKQGSCQEIFRTEKRVVEQTGFYYDMLCSKEDAERFKNAPESQKKSFSVFNASSLADFIESNQTFASSVQQVRDVTRFSKEMDGWGSGMHRLSKEVGLLERYQAGQYTPESSVEAQNRESFLKAAFGFDQNEPLPDTEVLKGVLNKRKRAVYGAIPIDSEETSFRV